MNNTLFPQDILRTFFSNLAFPDLATCRRVCKFWKSAVDEKSIIPELIRHGTWPPQLHVEKEKITNAWHIARENGLLATYMRQGQYGKQFVTLPFGMTPTFLISKHGKVFVASKEGFVSIFEANSLRLLICVKVTQSSQKIGFLEATSDSLYVGVIDPNISARPRDEKPRTEIWSYSLTELDNFLLTTPSRIAEINNIALFNHEMSIHPGFESYLAIKISPFNRFFLYHRSGMPIYGTEKETLAFTTCFYQNFLYLIEFTLDSEDHFLKVFDLSRAPEENLCIYSSLLEMPREYYHFKHMEIREGSLRLYGWSHIYHFKLEETGLPQKGNVIKFDTQNYPESHPCLSSMVRLKTLPSYLGTNYSILDNQLMSFDRKTQTFCSLTTKLDINDSHVRSPMIDFANQKVFLMHQLGWMKGFSVFESNKTLTNRRVTLLKSFQWRGEQGFGYYLLSYTEPLFQLVKIVSITATGLFLSIRFYPIGMAALPPFSTLLVRSIIKFNRSLFFPKIIRLILFLFSLPVCYWLPNYSLPNQLLQSGLNDYKEWIFQKLARERTLSQELIPFKETINKDLLHICPISGDPIRFPVKLNNVIYERSYISEVIVRSDNKPYKFSDLQFQSTLHQKIETELRAVKARAR